MSDLSINNDAWLSKLRSHLDTESYTTGTVSQYMGVARRFVADLNKHSVAITATRPEDIDRYLQQASWMHPLPPRGFTELQALAVYAAQHAFARGPGPMAASCGCDHACHEVATGDL
jgi:hypothetical protein